MAESVKSFTVALRDSGPTLEWWISRLLKGIALTGNMLPKALDKLLGEMQQTLPEPPALDLPLLGASPEIMNPLGLPGVYEQRLQRYTASFAAIKKLQDEIAQRERDLLEAPILGLTPQQVRSLGIELDTLRQQLAKLLDPQVLQQRKAATTDVAQTAAKHAADTIAGYARALTAQEDANEERLEEERRVQRELQRIRDQVTAQMQRDDASERRTQEAANRDAFGRVKQRIDAERQEWEQTQREFARQHAALTAEVSDGLFGVLRGLTDASGRMVDVWSDALDALQATFLRTLSDMAAKALVANILIPVGVTSTGTTAAGGVDLSAFLGLFGGRSTGTTQVPGATVAATDEFGAVIGAPVGGTPGAAGTLVAGAGLGIGVGTTLNAGLQQAGVGSLASQALGGALGGASAGFVIGTAIPVIGNVVGAIAGAIIGAAVPIIMHLLGKEPDLPNFASAIQTAGSRRPGAFLPGGAVRGPFGFVGPTGAFQQERPDVPGPEFARAFALLDEALASHLSRRQVDIAAAALQAQGRGLRISFEEFDNELADITKDRMSTILGGLARDVGLRPGFQARVLRGIGTEEEDIPALEAAFAKATQFLETLRQLKHPEKPMGKPSRRSRP